MLFEMLVTEFATDLQNLIAKCCLSEALYT